MKPHCDQCEKFIDTDEEDIWPVDEAVLCTDCYYTFSYDIIKSNKIVAIKGAVDWAAYSGPAYWPDWKIAARGKKLSEYTANAIFPELTKEKYRL